MSIKGKDSVTMAMICTCRLNGNIGLEEVEIQRLTLGCDEPQPLSVPGDQQDGAHDTNLVQVGIS